MLPGEQNDLWRAVGTLVVAVDARSRADREPGLGLSIASRTISTNDRTSTTSGSAAPWEASLPPQLPLMAV